jgi:hypothetical protein
MDERPEDEELAAAVADLVHRYGYAAVAAEARMHRHLASVPS